MAEDLEQYGHWKRHLHDLGECEVKHGVRVSVVNLYTEERAIPKCRKILCEARTNHSPPVMAEKPPRVEYGLLLLPLFLLLLLQSVGRVFFDDDLRLSRAGRADIACSLLLLCQCWTAVLFAEKSIAVLPFDNLSRDPDNAFFTDGVQDEILLVLAKIADLKVISRTSVMQVQDRHAAQPARDRATARGRSSGRGSVQEPRTKFG